MVYAVASREQTSLQSEIAHEIAFFVVWEKHYFRDEKFRCNSKETKG